MSETNSVITTEEFNIIKKIPMVFIMGKERSGTTLLQTLLDGNPNMVAPPESDFIILLYPLFGKINNWTGNDVNNFVNELYKEPWIAKVWRINRNLLTASLLAIKEDADYPSICKVVYYYMRNEKHDVFLISDKNPIYVLFIPTLLKLFPEAKFIHLVREPRDNVNSHLKSFGVKNERFVALKWVAYNTILEKARNEIPEKFYTVLYENLVIDPASILKKLCVFLHIPYHDNMLYNAFPENLSKYTDQAKVLERAKLIHINLFQPINSSNIGKWKKEMNSQQLITVEYITGEFAAKKYNYPEGEHTGSISTYLKLRIFKSRIVYIIWQLFTRLKFKSYWFNLQYTKFNIWIGRDEEEFGKIN